LEGLFGRRLGRHRLVLCGQHFGKHIDRSQAGESSQVLSGGGKENSSLAPSGPLKRRRARRRIRLRRANTISTFFRRRQASTYCGVAVGARATSRASSCRSRGILRARVLSSSTALESAGVALQFAGAIDPRTFHGDATSGKGVEASDCPPGTCNGRVRRRRRSRRGRTCRRFGWTCRTPGCAGQCLSLMRLYRTRYTEQIETADAETILGRWE
jgi:hypothetical protein